MKQVIECLIKPDADPEAVIRIANDLSKLDGPLDVAVGRGTSTDRDVEYLRPESGNRTVLFLLTFPNENAFQMFATGTPFRHIRDDLIAPACTRVVVHSLILEDYRFTEQYQEETTTATRQRRAAALRQQNELRSQTK